MKNNRITRAYDSINPSIADKQRMLDAILAEAKLEDKPEKPKRAKKEPVIYTAKPTKTSKLGVIGGLAACLAVFVIGGYILLNLGGTPVDPAYAEPTTETTEATEPAETAPEVPDSVYKETLERYNRAMDQGWNRTMCKANSMSMLTPIESGQESLYYALYDLNSDGTDELIISEYPYREDTDTSFIDIYTVTDGEVKNVMSLGDVAQRSLCEGGFIKQLDLEHGEYSSYASYWKLDGISFQRELTVYEKDGQWFTEGYRGVGAAITKAEADEIVAAYPSLKLDFSEIGQEEQSEYLTGYEAYDYIVNKYVTALSENWTSSQCEEHDISPYIFKNTTIFDGLGWCLLDVDENGVEELVISDGVSLFDLYTILPTDGGAAHVVMSNGGETWQLCENGVLQMHGLYSGTNAWRYYTLSDIDLKQRDMVFYEGSTNQYYYGANDNDLKPIDKNEVGNLFARDRTAELALTPFVVPESFDPYEMEYYDSLLDIYCQAVREEWNPGQCVEKGISMMIGYYGELYGELGYSLMDLNGDSVKELIITDGSNIFDLYTIIQDEETGPLHLISAMERQTYYLVKDMRIYCMGSGSAAVQYHTLYTLDETELTLLEGYMYDTDTWYFYDGDEQGEPCGSFDPLPIINDYMNLGIQNTKFE